MIIKKRFTVILSLLLALMLAAPGYAAMTSEEKDEKYRTAVLELEAYLESYGKGDISLVGIEMIFESLGGYAQSGPLLYYTQVMEKLADDDYGYRLDSLLLLLKNNERFGEYLSETLKDSAIMPVQYLTDYAEGRRKEYEGDIEGAMSEYEKCSGFFDADIRYMGLRDDRSEAFYRDGISLLEKEDLAGAYYAFSRANRYKDSEENKAVIVTMLGYTPADENDNPGKVTGLRASKQDVGQITLAWNSAKHASEYEVAYRKKGTKAWTVSETTGKNAATVSGLAADTAYDFRVTAIAGTVRTESAELAGVLTATPTPTPLVLQQAGGLKAQKTEPTSITLVWNSVPYAKGYRVMVKEDRKSTRLNSSHTDSSRMPSSA